MGISGGTNRAVQLRAPRRDGATVERRAVFLEVLAERCNIQAAAAAAGINRASIGRLRKRDAEFDALCIAALEDGYQRLEEQLIARALGQVGSGDNPGPEDRERAAVAIAPTPGEIDTSLALRVLALRDRHGSTRRPRPSADPVARHVVEAALLRKLDALLRKVKA